MDKDMMKKYKWHLWFKNDKVKMLSSFLSKRQNTHQKKVTTKQMTILTKYSATTTIMVM